MGVGAGWTKMAGLQLGNHWVIRTNMTLRLVKIHKNRSTKLNLARMTIDFCLNHIQKSIRLGPVRPKIHALHQYASSKCCNTLQQHNQNIANWIFHDRPTNWPNETKKINHSPLWQQQLLPHDDHAVTNNNIQGCVDAFDNAVLRDCLTTDQSANIRKWLVRSLDPREPTG